MAIRSKSKPAEVTAPVIPADEALANQMASLRDASFIEEQGLRQTYAGLEAHYDREEQRLASERRKKLGAVAAQIAQQQRVVATAGAAVEMLSTNVVSLKAAE